MAVGFRSLAGFPLGAGVTNPPTVGFTSLFWWMGGLSGDAVATPPSGGGGVDRFHDYSTSRRAKVRKLEETIVEAYAKLPGETKSTALDAVVEADGDPAKLSSIVESLASQLLSKDSIDKKLKFQKAERLRKANEAAVANMRRQAEELKAQRIAEFEEQQQIAHAMMLEEEAVIMLLLA